MLLVLLALFALCAPFLMTARNAHQAAGEVSDRATARAALDSATRHARAVLGNSHPSRDRTPYFDSESELDVSNLFADGFLNANDPHGVMWDLEVADCASRIDLDTAPPQLLANLAGWTSRLARPLEAGTTEVLLTGTGRLDESGVLEVGGELISYGSLNGATLREVTRGLLSSGGDTPSSSCSPLPGTAHPAGTLALDQRAWALPRWRVATSAGEPRHVESHESVREAQAHAIGGPFPPEFLAAIARTTSPYAHVGAGVSWQRPERITRNLIAGVDCLVTVRDARWFGPGTTVELSDGDVHELALVIGTDLRSGLVRLAGPVASDYRAERARIRARSRRPVNINTASLEVLRALLANVGLADRNSRISQSEAASLARIIEISRPFENFEDFVRRVVLPAAALAPLPRTAPVVPEAFADLEIAGELDEDGTTQGGGGGLISEDDALALYFNARNANDARLAFGTLPFGFVSRDAYELDLRAAVNAKSGVERLSSAREHVFQVVPQDPLTSVWSRQVDFEEALRLTRGAPFWATGPSGTSRRSALGSTVPPSRATAHLGIRDSQTGERSHEFASLDPEDSFATLWPTREPETGPRLNRMLHFDRDASDPDGRDLADETIAYTTVDPKVQWRRGASTQDYLRPFSLSFWFKLRATPVDGEYLFDVAGSETWNDRVSITVGSRFGDPELVLRVMDAAGDHRDTAEPVMEWGEARYPIAKSGPFGATPGLPVETWMHVLIDVRGTRPDQILMLVDGRASSWTPGLTRLSANLEWGAGVIEVESTRGFPEECTLRIGNEVIEARVSDEHRFVVINEGDYNFGGRQARERVVAYSDGIPVPESVALVDLYPGGFEVGTTVQHYGYSTPLASNAVVAQGGLTSTLGDFGVARVVGLDGLQNAQGDPIFINVRFLNEIETVQFQVGTGIARTLPTAIVLESADGNELDLNAFQADGGYVALVAKPFSFNASGDGVVSSDENPNGGGLGGGVEVFRYVRREGNRLILTSRGDAGPSLTRVPSGHVGGNRVFVTEWGGVTPNAEGKNGDLDWQVLVVPISVRATGLADFPPRDTFRRQFEQVAQFTTSDPRRTEWVTYDEILGDAELDAGYLVRSNVDRLDDVRDHTVGPPEVIPVAGLALPTDPSGGPGTDTGGGTPIGGTAAAFSPPPFAGPAPAPSPTLAATSSAVALQETGGPIWSHVIGAPDAEPGVVARTVESWLEFRGTCGTYSHSQDAGTLLLPVQRLANGSVDLGRPGRNDRAFLLDVLSGEDAWPVVVRHSHRPFAHRVFEYSSNGLQAVADGSGSRRYDASLVQHTLVGFESAVEAPIPTSFAWFDPRYHARLVKFPSGELPRVADQLQIGGQVSDPSAGIPSAVVDEMFFASNEFGDDVILQAITSSAGNTTSVEDFAELNDLEFLEEIEDVQVLTEPDYSLGLVLGTGVDSEVRQLGFLPDALRTSWMTIKVFDAVVSELPSAGGLLRMGDEIIGYSSIQPQTGRVVVAENGRGMLGTDPQPHLALEAAYLLEPFIVSSLSSPMAVGDNEIQLIDASNFPDEGTVMIDDELMHYTLKRGNVLVMPRGSTMPGRDDGRGAGLFRGRYGTTPSTHGSTALAIVHPTRYWDRWEERADAPELSYFDLSQSSPGAYWRNFTWIEEPPVEGQSRIGVLWRTDPTVPWDSEPDSASGLHLSYVGTPVDGNPVGQQSDSIEWRLFVDYPPGSYDAELGLSHGWKSAPKLDAFLLEYIAPGRVFRSLDR